MLYNPYARIRELEHQLERAELSRVRAEDEARLYHSQLVAAQEEAQKAWALFVQKTEKVEDWMAGLMRQPPLHNQAPVEPRPQPQPIVRPVAHGARLEQKLTEQYEHDLGITPN